MAEQTAAELTAFEKSFVLPFVYGFQKRIGPKQSITNTQIRRKFGDSRLTELNVRNVIRFIRTNQAAQGWFGNKILIAKGTGYFITEDAALVNAWVESLQGQINSRQELINGAQHALQVINA